VEDPLLARWLQDRGFALSEPANADILITPDGKSGSDDFITRGGRVLRMSSSAGGKDTGYRILGSIRAVANEISPGTGISAGGVLPEGADFTLHSGGSGTNGFVRVVKARTESLNTVPFASHFLMGPARQGAYLYADLLRKGRPSSLAGTTRLGLTVAAIPFGGSAKVASGKRPVPPRLVPILRSGPEQLVRRLV